MSQSVHLSKYLIVMLVLLLSTPPVQAQLWQVEVEDSSTDPVGERLVFLIKEGIRRSSSMELTVADTARLTVIIKTMPRFSEDRSIATVYAVIWVYRSPQQPLGMFVDATMGYAGTQVVSESAQGIVAKTDQLLSNIGKALLRSR